MLNTDIQTLINWLIGIGATSLIAVIVGVLNVIRGAKMLPRDLRGADLSNEIKEADLSDKLDKIASSAADKAINAQARLDKLEADYDVLKETVRNQSEIITNQDSVIKSQSKKIDNQAKKLKNQEVEISMLICELNNSRLYIKALIEQLSIKQVIPVSMESIEGIENCEDKNSIIRNSEEDISTDTK